MYLTQVRHTRKGSMKVEKQIRNKYTKERTERQKLENQKSESDVGNAIMI